MHCTNSLQNDSLRLRPSPLIADSVHAYKTCHGLHASLPTLVLIVQAFFLLQNGQTHTITQETYTT